MRAALALAVALVAAPASAQLSAQTHVSASHVAVGEPLLVQLAVSGSSRANPTDARLPSSPGLSVSGPNVSTQTQMTISNGQMSQSVGVTLTWSVTAARPGRYRVGPPSVVMNGERAEGSPVVFDVSAGPAAPSPGRRRGQFPFDPFDFLDPFGRGRSPFPPGLGFPDPFSDDDEQRDQAPPFPEEFRVEHAPDPTAFLRVTLTPDHAVVGQQVTLNIYAYGSRGSFNTNHATEPLRGDFLSYRVDLPADQFFNVPVDGARFLAQKINQLALFPLHAGRLKAGAMSLEFLGRGYGSSGPNRGLERDTPGAEVVVVEPPLAGRPAGYKLGDVGNFKLTASVEPNTILAGEAVSVIATLRGTGNLPMKLLTPERRGVEWLEPTTTEQIEPDNGMVQGERHFTYVVRIDQPGDVELGDLTLPYYDPAARAYRTARARLGRVAVKPNPNLARKTAASKPVDRLAGLLAPRAELGAPAVAAPHLDDRRGFWALLLLGPFGVALTGAGVTLGTRLVERRRARQGSLESELKAALKNLHAAAGARDPQVTAGAAERAVLLGIELRVGVKARAILKSELPALLVERGLTAELARELAQILEECDTLRFVGAAANISTSELAARAEQCVSRVSRARLS